MHLKVSSTKRRPFFCRPRCFELTYSNLAIWYIIPYFGDCISCGIGQLESMQYDGTVHYSDVTMSVMASRITGVSIVCSAVCSGVAQRKHQSSASLAFVRGIHRWPVDSLHKGPVTWKTFPFDDVIMVDADDYTRTWSCGFRFAIDSFYINSWKFLNCYYISLDEATLKNMGKWITILH